MEYQEFYRGRTCSYWWCNGTDPVDQALLGGTRNGSTHNNYLPRQHEYHPVGRKREIFKFKKNSTHKRTILFCDRPSKKRLRKNRILSYREHVGGFLYEATAGSVFKNMRKIILNMPDDANGNTGHRSVLGIDKKTTGNEKSDENAVKAPAEENRTRNIDTGMKEKWN